MFVFEHISARIIDRYLLRHDQISKIALLYLTYSQLVTIQSLSFAIYSFYNSNYFSDSERFEVWRVHWLTGSELQRGGCDCINKKRCYYQFKVKNVFLIIM